MTDSVGNINTKEQVSSSALTLDTLNPDKVQFWVSQSQENSSKPSFGQYDAKAEWGKKETSWRKWMSVPWALLLMSISGFVGLVFFGMTYITSLAVENAPENATSIWYYESTFTWIDDMISYPGIGLLEQQIAGVISSDTFSTIVSSSVPFYFKRQFMESSVARMLDKLIRDAEALNTVQKDIAKYGFLHPELMAILNTDKDIIPIITSLHTVETVKFWTALKMFSLLDTFLSQSSRLLGVDKTELESQMKLYANRWEKDISRFLSACYLNPYEVLPDCNQIWDFANYFRYDDTTSSIDYNLLSKILVIIDNKLEQSDLPSLQINFDRFTPNSKSLWFRIIVNTLPEDEAAFLNKGIINPHIFIISNLVNLLKQSLFVIGDSINVNKLNIQKKDISLGDIQIPVSTSSMNFNLPLQNSSEREIYDFYDTTDTTAVASWDIANL